MKIDHSVANVLANSTIDGNKLYLPKVQLERKLYLSVNKVLESLDGKWNRKEKAHVFGIRIGDAVEQILQSGEYTDRKKEYNFFETPNLLAEKLVCMAEIRKGETILEPSAGRGRIAQLIPGCDCVELEEGNSRWLEENGFNVVGRDFLLFDKEYDVIVANPPFTSQQDIDHVTHMVGLARRRVVSVMSASVSFRDDRKTKEFRNLLEKCDGRIELLPDGSFAESGTNVRACVVVVDTNGNS